MSDEKTVNLNLSKREAIKIIIRIRYCKEPQRFEKINNLINTLNDDNPIPSALKNELKKDIPCLILLNYFINPKFYYNTTDKLINSKVNFLDEMVRKIQIVCHRAKEANTFWLFVKKVISYFRDPSQYFNLHKFFISITKSQEELKFLLSFTNQNIIFSPQEFVQSELPKPTETRDDYVTFLQLIGIDTTPIDDRYEYKKEKITKPLKSYFNIREEFVDINNLPTVTYSYRDESFLMEHRKSSNSTPFIDMIVNKRYFNIQREPISTASSSASSSQTPTRSSTRVDKNEKVVEVQKICFDDRIQELYALESSELLHDQEYRMGLLEMSFFDLKKHFCFSSDVMSNIISEVNKQLNLQINRINYNNKTQNMNQNVPNISKFNLNLNENNDNNFNFNNSNDNGFENGNFNNINNNFESENCTKEEDKSGTKDDENYIENLKGPLRQFFMHQHWRVYRMLSIIYDKSNSLPVERIFRLTYNNGQRTSANEQVQCVDISDRVEKIMRHIYSAMVKMKINWYHSQYLAFRGYSFSKLRVFPHPEYCEISIMHLENYNFRDATYTANFLSKFNNAIMSAYSEFEKISSNNKNISENSLKILMDRYSIELLTFFSQYYKAFVCYYYYPFYIRPPISLLNAATRWKDIYFYHMKEIIGRGEIEEEECLNKMFFNESVKKVLYDMAGYLIKKEYINESASPNLVVATFVKESQCYFNGISDSVVVKVKPAIRTNICGITDQIFEPRSRNNSYLKDHKKNKKK